MPKAVKKAKAKVARAAAVPDAVENTKADPAMPDMKPTADDEVMLNPNAVTAKADQMEEEKEEVLSKQMAKPSFPALSAKDMAGGKIEVRKVRVPPHRYTPLRQNWENVMKPIVEYLKLQIRMNPRTRNVELKTSEYTTEASALQKGADFIHAFMLGFEVQDAMALLRLDDLYIDTFEIHDVKTLKGDHMSRAIGRIAGQSGKTRYAIENATRTRVVLADKKIHILGSFANIKIARDAICSLIMGSPPGKVYNQMKIVANRMSERF
jgi:RNA-binding protein PNO1